MVDEVATVYVLMLADGEPFEGSADPDVAAWECEVDSPDWLDSVLRYLATALCLDGEIVSPTTDVALHQLLDAVTLDILYGE